jgi:hypothetical protein
MVELTRKHSIAENTLCRCRYGFRGMEVTNGKRLRELAQENRGLTHLLAQTE